MTMSRSNFECCHKCKPPRRQVGCHATCKDYLKAKEKNDREREAKRLDNGSSYITMGSFIGNAIHSGRHNKNH